jgi:hypothetical protein
MNDANINASRALRVWISALLLFSKKKRLETRSVCVQRIRVELSAAQTHLRFAHISRNDVLDAIHVNVSCWANRACIARMGATFAPTTNAYLTWARQQWLRSKTQTKHTCVQTVGKQTYGGNHANARSLNFPARPIRRVLERHT